MATIAKLNFRATAGYVADAPGETYVLPTDAYTGSVIRNGLKFGYVGVAPSAQDRSTAYGPRFAGRHNYSGTTSVFRIDLPPGTYILKAAQGNVSAAATVELALYDGVQDDAHKITSFLNGNNGAAGQCVDLTKVVRTFAAWDTEAATITAAIVNGSLLITTPRTTSTYLNHLQIESVVPDLVDPSFRGNLVAVGGVEGEFVAEVNGTAVNSELTLQDTFGGRFKIVEITPNKWEIQTGPTPIVEGDPASWAITTVETLTGSANSPHATTAPLTVYKRLNPASLNAISRTGIHATVSTLAIAAYNRGVLPWASGRWASMNGVTPDATLTATSSADLVAKWNSLTDRTKKTVIKLDSTQPASNWSVDVNLNGSATAGGDPYFGGSKDFVAGGGGVLIESSDPLNPVLFTGEFKLTGCRGVHVRDVGMCKKFPAGTGGTTSHGAIVTASGSYKELSVVVLERILIGALHADPLAPPADWGVGLMTQFTGQAHEQIDIVDCQFKGCYKGIRGGYTRYWKLHGCDFQQIAADCTIVVRGDTLFAPRNAAWSDETMYCWELGNTARNLLDDAAFATEHTDIFQHGTGVDCGPTVQASMFNVAHSAKDQYYDSNFSGLWKRYFGGVQGFYNDDTTYALESALLQNIACGAAQHQLSAYNGEGHIEHNTAGRSGTLPPSATTAVDGFNFGINDTPSMTHSGAGYAYGTTLHYIRRNVIGQVIDYFNGASGIETNTNTDEAIIRDNAFVMWSTKVPSAATPDAMLAGTFTQDAENRWVWAFDESGSQQAFRERLYDHLKLVSGTAGATDPRLWPTSGGVAAPPTVVVPIADKSNVEGAVIGIDVSAHFDGATGYGATGLPTGLAIDAGSGLISGTIAVGAHAISPFAVEITASNGAGSVVDNFAWVITAAPPALPADAGHHAAVKGAAASTIASPILRPRRSRRRF